MDFSATISTATNLFTVQFQKDCVDDASEGNSVVTPPDM